MPKPANAKKSDQKPSKKRLPAKQEKPLKDIKVKHAPPVSSKDIIAKAEANVRATKPTKSKPAPKPVVKKPVSESSSSEDSSSSESESDSLPPKAAIRETKTNGKSAPSKKNSPTKPPTLPKNKKTQRVSLSDSSSDSNSSSDDSSSEDETPAKPAPLAAKPNGTSKPKPAESGSSSEEESSEDTSDGSTANTKPSIMQKATPNDDSRDSEDDSSEDDKPKAQQIKTVPKSANSSDEGSSSSSEDSDSASDTPPKPLTLAPKKAQQTKDSSSDSDPSSDDESSSSDSDEDVEMEDPTLAVAMTGKRKAEDSHTLPAKKAKTINGSTAVTKSEESLTKTIFVGNLSWAVDNDRLSQEFADCGEVVSARVQLDRNTGKSRGFGYVTFATTEAVDAAIALNGTMEIDGRTPNLDRSTDVGPNREKRAQAFGDVRSTPSKVLFVGNLSWNTVEDTLWDIFSEYGEVSSVRLPTDRETGKPKGYGYIEFSAVDSAQKAIAAMNGRELDGRPIRLDFSQPRDSNGAGRGRGTGFGGGRGRGGFDGGRGRGSGRGRGGDRGRGRGGTRGGMRTGAIATPEGQKITF